MFANQFNNLAHSGANHLVRRNISVRFISIQPCQHSDCTVAGFMSAVSTDQNDATIWTATAGGVVDAVSRQSVDRYWLTGHCWPSFTACTC